MLLRKCPACHQKGINPLLFQGSLLRRGGYNPVVCKHCGAKTYPNERLSTALTVLIAFVAMEMFYYIHTSVAITWLVGLALIRVIFTNKLDGLFLPLWDVSDEIPYYDPTRPQDFD